MSHQRANSFSCSTIDTATATISLSRGNTLRKKASLRGSGGLHRSSSRRSMRAGSVRSLAVQSKSDPDVMRSAFYCPVPTSGSPTEALAERFQSWRKYLKDLVSYFKEVHSHYEARSKSLTKLGNVLGGIQAPPSLLASSGGLADGVHLLQSYNTQAIKDANKAREIEGKVVHALTGLRRDLGEKIKEIKNLSGDFKNTVDKETNVTRKAVKALQDALGQVELDPASATGMHDPYLLRLAADQQVEKQIAEENYLHQAYLNLESSGRELESIVVGEIQKALNAYAGILKREAAAAFDAMDNLHTGPIPMPKDREWNQFVLDDSQFVDPDIPIRSAEHIYYPGKDHPACQELRGGLLERKRKYLKSFSPGWHVLSPTHLHEFKSADKGQAPVMSLYLPEQELGSRSREGEPSNKFTLKGRQTGGVHRGHTWVFRAESHDTMLAWYADIQVLTEKSPEKRNQFGRSHTRSASRASHRSRASRNSISSDSAALSESDGEPFNNTAAVAATAAVAGSDSHHPDRPEPGGRFPSDLQVLRLHHEGPQPYQHQQQDQQQDRQQQQHLHQRVDGVMESHSPSTTSSLRFSNLDREAFAAATTFFGSASDSDQQQQQRGPLQRSEYSPSPSPASANVIEGNTTATTSPTTHSPTDPHSTYGSTAQTPMREAVSHAAMVSRDAHEDGVNPYTNQPIDSRHASVNHSHGIPSPVSPASISGSRASATTGTETSIVHFDDGTVPAAMAVREKMETQANNTTNTNVKAEAPLSPPPSVREAVGVDVPPAPAESVKNRESVASGADSGDREDVSQPATSGPVRMDMTQTTSNLHVPGEFPKVPPAMPAEELKQGNVVWWVGR